MSRSFIRVAVVARLARSLLLAAAIGVLADRASRRKAPRFYRDDPIAREPEPQDASSAQP